LHRLEENIAAAEVKLTAGDLDEIERAAAEIRVERRTLSRTSAGDHGPLRPEPDTHHDSMP
jgi:hypothetical protein